MTEHSKIPLPGQPEADEEASLLERAVRAFDLGKLAPPPVPSSLAPPVIKPAQRNRPVRKAAVEETPAPQHEEIFSALVEAEPEPAPPAPEPVAKAEPEIEPVRFRPVHHAVDRNRLRDQGMIVPEGSVTALLEEFRIVKRQLLLHASELRQQGGGMASQRVLVCSPHPGEGKTYTSVNLALSILTAVTVVVSMRVVGLLLVSALMIIPNAAAQLLAGSFGSAIRLATTLGVLAAVGGVVTSFYAETPFGGTIVLIALAFFVVADMARRLAGHWAHHHAPAERHDHEHGPDCGHQAVPHGDHVDYLHDGHRHAPHDDHYDEHHQDQHNEPGPGAAPPTRAARPSHRGELPAEVGERHTGGAA